jgi:hypothetical protein
LTLLLRSHTPRLEESGWGFFIDLSQQCIRLLRFMDYFDYWVGNVYCFSFRDAVDEIQTLRLQPAETFSSLRLVRTGPCYWWPSLKVA